jgi:excisionase family DNA binding protein
MVEAVATIGLEDAARFLHMAPSTLRKRAAAGKLSAYKPGKTWVFMQDELLHYLKSTKSACPSIDAPTLRIGGPDSSSTAARSASRLAQEIVAKRRNLKP